MCVCVPVCVRACVCMCKVHNTPHLPERGVCVEYGLSVKQSYCTVYNHHYAQSLLAKDTYSSLHLADCEVAVEQV